MSSIDNKDVLDGNTIEDWDTETVEDIADTAIGLIVESVERIEGEGEVGVGTEAEEKQPKQPKQSKKGKQNKHPKQPKPRKMSIIAEPAVTQRLTRQSAIDAWMSGLLMPYSCNKLTNCCGLSLLIR